MQNAGEGVLLLSVILADERVGVIGRDQNDFVGVQGAGEVGYAQTRAQVGEIDFERDLRVLDVLVVAEGDFYLRTDWIY